MYKELVTLVPTRGRPQNVVKVLNCWRETKAFNHADLLFIVDADDPKIDDYRKQIVGTGAAMYVMPQWQPMVHKLNEVAVIQAAMPWREAVGFAGDDHLPRTEYWSRKYLYQLRAMGTGIAYGNDLHQGQKLPTEWCMTVDIINALGRMVPAPVEHLYCDNSILDLGIGADCIEYMPTVIIEHMHPIWRKGEWDQQYKNVNSKRQYAKDGAVFEQWERTQLWRDIAKIHELKRGHEDANDIGTALDVQAAAGGNEGTRD